MRTRYQFRRMVNDYYDKKQKKEGESEKSHDSHAKDASEGGNGDGLKSNKVRRSEEEIVKLSSDKEERDSHATKSIVRKSGDELESNKVRRSGKEMVRVRDKEKRKNVSEKISRKKMKGTAKRDKIAVADDGEDSGSDVRLLGQVEIEEEVNRKDTSQRTKRSKQTVYKGKNSHDDEGSGSDVVLVNQEIIPFNVRVDLVMGRKQFSSRRKGGRSDGNRIQGRMIVENERSGEVAQEKGKGLLVENLDALDSESSGFKKVANGSDGLVKGRKLLESRRKRGRNDGVRMDERMMLENENPEGAEEKGKDLLIENLDALDLESTSSEEDGDDSDDLIKGRKLLDSRRKQGRNVGIRIDEKVMVETGNSEEGAEEKGKVLLVENLDALDLESSSTEEGAHDSYNLVKLFESRKEQGGGDGIRIDKEMTVENKSSGEGTREKENGLLVENLDALDLEPSSSEKNADDSNNLVRGRKLFGSGKEQGGSDGTRIDEGMTVENECSGEGAHEKGSLLVENLDALDIGSSSSEEDGDGFNELVKGRKRFVSIKKQGKRDGPWIDERVPVENDYSRERAQEKGKGLLVENIDALDLQSSSSDEDADGSDNLVKDRKLFVSIKERRRRDGIQIDERMTVENLDALDSQSSSSEEDANDSDKDYNKEESSSTDIQSIVSGYGSEDNIEEGAEKVDSKNSETSAEDSDSSEVPGKKRVGTKTCELTRSRERVSTGLGYGSEGNPEQQAAKDNRKISDTAAEESDSSDVPKKKIAGSRMRELPKRRERVTTGLDYGSNDNPQRRAPKDDRKISGTSAKESDSSDVPEKKMVGSGMHELPKRRERVSTRSGCCSEDNPENGIEKDDSKKSDSSDNVTKKKKVESRIPELSKKRKRALREVDYMNILLGSILKDDGNENLFSFEENVPPTQTLPLKFRFEDEYPAPPEKEEWEKEINNLFAEMEMCLTLLEYDTAESSTDGVDHATAAEMTPIDLCQSGQHQQLVLEEPLGIICKCCGKVVREMKDIFPDLIKETQGRRDRFDLPRDAYRNGIHGFHFGESSSENYRNFTHSKGSVLDLMPEDVKLSMYRHQWEGFLFLWKNIVGETCIEKLKSELSDDGVGAIISHAPGTGKTFLTIAFIASMLERYPTCQPVIIAPTSMLLTWENEFQKWGYKIPFHNYNSKNLSGKEVKTHAEILQRLGSRMTKLYSWTKQPSVLGISYKMFERIASGRLAKGCDGLVKVKRAFLELPGLLVLDEGHTPRNQKSLVWKVLAGVKTKRKVILSGTPFQNNFDELYNTLCLVNPKLSDSVTSESYSKKGQRKSVEKERWSFLANKIDKRSEHAVEEIKSMIDPFVHVHKGGILEESLPGLKDTLVILRPTDAQQELLQFVSNDFSKFDQVPLVSHISVHPSLAAYCKRFSSHKDKLVGLGSNPYAGVKTKFAMELIKLCVPLNEKVLVFSEFIRPLEFIMHKLMDQLKWTEGKEVLYMDGKCEEKDRQASISSLNEPSSEVKVLFASIRACSEGINLSGASRVVLLDAVWNPSVERQAISRAYRLGQKKLVHVYHLITTGTLEKDKYARQTNKDRLSELVFSRGSQSMKSRNSSTSEDKILEAMLDNENLSDMFEQIIHQPKESNVFASFNYVEHQP